MSYSIFKEKGLKDTINRELVFDVMDEYKGPMTAEQIYNLVYVKKKADFSTIYRTLSVFTEKNITNKCMGTDGVAYYQLYNQHHAHYIVCSECHKKIIIDECPLVKASEDLMEKTGFQITGHNLEFIGICPECILKNNKNKE